jgi:hypothetical protein
MRSATPPRALTALLLALAPLLISALAHAGTARARIAVSVTVVRPATMRSETTPSELVISDADIKRGYLVRRHVTEAFVESNSPVAFAIDVSPATRLFSQVQISTSGGKKATFGADGGQLVGWLGGQSPHLLVLDFLLKLSPGIEPGHYPWPLSVEVRLEY